MKANQRILLISTVALALILATGILKTRFSVESGDDRNHFWAEKLFWKNRFDMVLAGDSRTYRGLAPKVLQSVLGNSVRIGNFGFSSCGYGEQYLQEIEGLFDKRSHQKAIVLGVTPGALTESSARINNGYLNLKRQDIKDLYIMRYFGNILSVFEPFTMDDIATFLHSGKAGYFQVYHPDGWVASRKVPEHENEALGPYRKNWEHQKVSPQIIAGLLEKVQEWRQKGIQVYGFSPPTSQELYDLEQQMSGFDREAFKKRFKAAGGVWLPVPIGKYHCYDGSHLREDSARLLSKDVADALRQHNSIALKENSKL